MTLAVQIISEADKMAKERESHFEGEVLEDERERYLDNIKSELNSRSRALRHHLFEIGKLLFEAKKYLPHGEFKPWVEKNFDQSYETANNCMNVYLSCMGIPEVVEYFNPSCLYLMCKPSFPDDLREALFTSAKGPVDIKQKELVEMALKFKDNQLSFEDETVQKALKNQREVNILKRYQNELKAIEKFINSSLKKMKDLSKLYDSQPLIISIEEDEKSELEDFKDVIESSVEGSRDSMTFLIEEIDRRNGNFT